MWYMLADVNGLSASDKLTAGQMLSIPNKVTNIHNNSETFRPYSPGEAIGDTQPTVPSPPPPPTPKKKCGGIAQIVMIIVAVVVTIYTAGAASAAFGALAAGTSVTTAVGTTALFSTGIAALGGASIGAAMVGAAVGSAASQLVGKAMGAVDSFSWSQVGVSALTAGATAGVGAGIGQLASKGYSWAQTASNAINTVNSGGNATWAQAVGVGAYAGAVGYGSNYIANQIFGNNQSFSWAGLGSSIVGSVAGASLGKSGAFNALGKTASPYAYAVAGANAAATIDDKWFGGSRPDYLNVSMAAIANTVGRQFGNKAESWLANNKSSDIVADFNEEEFLRLEAERSKTRPLLVADVSHYNGSLSDIVSLEKITLSAADNPESDEGITYALDGVSSAHSISAMNNANAQERVFPVLKAISELFRHDGAAQVFRNSISYVRQKDSDFENSLMDPSLPEPLRATGVFLRPAAKLGFSIFEGAYGTGLLITNPETAQQFANSIYSFASNDPIATTKASLNQFLDQPSYEIGTQVFAGAGSAVISGGVGASAKSAITKGFSSGGGFPPAPAYAIVGGGEFVDSAATTASVGGSFDVSTAIMMSVGQADSGGSSSTASAGATVAATQTIKATVGKNTIEWVVDADGSPISASGTLREYYSGAKRSSAEKAAQNRSAKSGVADDQGGHAIGHRFVLDQGAKNMFPQEGNFNMAAFKTIENDYARYIDKGYDVHFEHKLGNFDPVTKRPSTVSVIYEVTDIRGNVVDTFNHIFHNKSGQIYQRRAY